MTGVASSGQIIFISPPHMFTRSLGASPIKTCSSGLFQIERAHYVAFYDITYSNSRYSINLFYSLLEVIHYALEETDRAMSEVVEDAVSEHIESRVDNLMFMAVMVVAYLMNDVGGT